MGTPPLPPDYVSFTELGGYLGLSLSAVRKTWYGGTWEERGFPPTTRWKNHLAIRRPDFERWRQTRELARELAAERLAAADELRQRADALEADARTVLAS